MFSARFPGEPHITLAVSMETKERDCGDANVGNLGPVMNCVSECEVEVVREFEDCVCWINRVIKCVCV